MSTLGDLLNGTLDTIAAPGQYTRGLLSGRPGEKLGGRDMLESWGMLRPNKPGFDMGDVAGFLAEAIVDPINLIPLGAIGGALKLSRGAKAAKGLGLMEDALGAVSQVGPGKTLAGLSMDSIDDLKSALAVGGNDAMRNAAMSIRPREMRLGLQDIGQEYVDKFADTVARTGEQNVINPNSGLHMWRDARRGLSDAERLAQNRYGAIKTYLLDEQPIDMEAMYNSNARLVPESLGSKTVKLDEFGRPVIRQTIDPETGNAIIARGAPRSIGMQQTHAGSNLDMQPYGRHEGTHYMHDAENMADDTYQYLQAVPGRGAEQLKAAGSFQDLPVTEALVQDFTHPKEIYSRVNELRGALRDLGMPDLPGALKAGEKVAGFGPRANEVIDEMTRAYGVPLVRELIRNLPIMAGAVAAPVAASIYGDQA
jgi:hypothetical protein